MICEVAPRILSRTSCWKPVIKPKAMTSAMTPMAMPNVEMKVITEIKACFLLALR